MRRLDAQETCCKSVQTGGDRVPRAAPNDHGAEQTAPILEGRLHLAVIERGLSPEVAGPVDPANYL
jgi:hypothetical protein